MANQDHPKYIATACTSLLVNYCFLTAVAVLKNICIAAIGYLRAPANNIHP